MISVALSAYDLKIKSHTVVRDELIALAVVDKKFKHVLYVWRILY